MDKLKYDSFYKFLVSLGIILITLPFAGLIYIANFKVTLIDAKDYKQLSEYSQIGLVQKQQIFENIYTSFTTLAPFLFAFGVIFFAVGAYKWAEIQVLLDEQVHSDTKLKESESQIKEMNLSEIISKAKKEMEEEEKSEQNTEADNNIPINGTDTTPDSRSANLLKTLTVEAKVIEKLTEKYSSAYYVRSNIKIDNASFDAIAFSQLGDEPDIIFEIRYCKVISYSLELPTVIKLKRINDIYKREYKENCKLVYIVVCPKEKITALQMNFYPSFGTIQVEYWAEEDLFDNNN